MDVKNTFFKQRKTGGLSIFVGLKNNTDVFRFNSLIRSVYGHHFSPCSAPFTGAEKTGSVRSRQDNHQRGKGNHGIGRQLLAVYAW